MKTPPTARTSGIWAGKPHPPLLAEKHTMMPALTAVAISAASALAAASSGPFWMLRDQLHEMTVGFSAAAAATAAVVLTRLPEASAHLTGSSLMSGAVAKML